VNDIRNSALRAQEIVIKHDTYKPHGTSRNHARRFTHAETGCSAVSEPHEELDCMISSRIIRALLAGAISSAAMWAFMRFMPLLGGPNVDAIALLSTVSAQFGPLVPLTQYLLLSVIVFPFLYATLLYRDLPGSPWQKGLLWGVILFALRGLIVSPVMGQGLFGLGGEDHAVTVLIEMFVAHCIYGSLLGVIIGDQPRTKVQAYAPRERELQRRR